MEADFFFFLIKYCLNYGTWSINWSINWTFKTILTIKQVFYHNHCVQLPKFIIFPTKHSSELQLAIYIEIPLFHSSAVDSVFLVNHSAVCKHFAWHLDYFPLKFNAWCLKTTINTAWRVQTAQRNSKACISRQLKSLFPYHDSRMALCVVHSLSFRKFRMSFFPSPKHTYFTLISGSHVTA